MHLPNNTLLQGGKYKIIRFISAGGFGCTYEAMDTVNGRRVAIKELFVKDVSDRDENTLTISAFSTNKGALLDKVKRKFLEEANALRSMSHPNIVKVFDSFEENGTAYYVMEYIDGVSLHDLVKRNGPLPEDKAVKYIKQVAKALEYVHGRNRLHLDIKPGNIMIDRNDNAILIDFGVSKQYDEANGESTSTVLGKAPGYSPIEQLGNNIQQFTPATDIYALGATLYKCVTGNTPPDATTVLTEGLPSLPTGLKATTKKAIRQSIKPKVTERPQSISQFLDCFKVVAKPKPTPKPEAPHPYPTPEPPKENSSVWKWVLGVILLIGVGIGIYMNMNNSTGENVKIIDPQQIGNGTIGGHDYVDLGLPSGTKWATCNIGAASPSDFGNYYSWGETSTKSDYTIDKGKWANIMPSDLQSRNVIDRDGNLQSKYDAATQIWGSSWRMPTFNEVRELLEKCTWEWIKVGRHNGYRVTGPNGNSIFLPAAGCRGTDGPLYVNSYGGYWTATVYNNDCSAIHLYLSPTEKDCLYSYRYTGQSIRPVSN